MSHGAWHSSIAQRAAQEYWVAHPVEALERPRRGERYPARCPRCRRSWFEPGPLMVPFREVLDGEVTVGWRCI